MSVNDRTWMKIVAKLDALDLDIQKMIESLVLHADSKDLLLRMIQCCPPKPESPASSDNIDGYLRFVAHSMGIRAMWQRVGYDEAEDDRSIE